MLAAMPNTQNGNYAPGNFVTKFVVTEDHATHIPRRKLLKLSTQVRIRRQLFRARNQLPHELGRSARIYGE